MTSRREARRLALDVLYQADVTDEAPAAVLRDWREAKRGIPPFARQLVEGVVERQPDIDLLLEEHAKGWSVARMTSLDRSILRLAVYELLWGAGVPASVAISEAVEAAAELSAEDSKRFVNGVLGSIARGQGRDPDIPAER